MRKTMWVASLGLLFMASLANAQQAANPYDPHAIGDAEAGATKAATCTACHGPNGNSSVAQWPSLAGQSAVYTAEQLRLFKAKVRVSPVMQPVVDPLTDQDIADLAVYFEKQTPTGLEADPSYWQAGEALYRRGDPARNIPACNACHGPVGLGNLASGYPALRGQHSVYTVKQLNDFASGARYPAPPPEAPEQEQARARENARAQESTPESRNAPMMTTVAQRLTPEDIRNVASYIQGLR
jgi:cytochrome c553